MPCSLRGQVRKIALLERVREVKVEMRRKEERISQVLRAMIAAHPYQEPAFHVFKDYSGQFKD